MTHALFINDSELLLASLRRKLGDEGIAYVRCETVAEALAAIAAHDPDVLFLDHCLSEDGSEGWEILERCRERHSRIRVVSTTTEEACAEGYRRRGIEHVHPTDVARIRAILSPPRREST